MKKNDSEKNYSPYVYKLAETIDYIGGKDALLFVEQWERVDADHLPGYIDLLYEGKEHLSEVLHTINLITFGQSSSETLLELE